MDMETELSDRQDITRAEATKIIVNVKQLKLENGKTDYKDRLFFPNWSNPIYTQLPNMA